MLTSDQDGSQAEPDLRLSPIRYDSCKTKEVNFTIKRVTTKHKFFLSLFGTYGSIGYKP